MAVTISPVAESASSVRATTRATVPENTGNGPSLATAASTRVRARSPVAGFADTAVGSLPWLRSGDPDRPLIGIERAGLEHRGRTRQYEPPGTRGRISRRLPQLEE